MFIAIVLFSRIESFRNSKVDPQNLVLNPRKSKLEVRVSKLDSQFSKTSRIECWVETVNLPLSDTIIILCNHAVCIAFWLVYWILCDLHEITWDAISLWILQFFTYTVENWKIYRRLCDCGYALYIFSAYITPDQMLKLSRVTKVKVFFLVLVWVFSFDLFEFSVAILEKGLLLLLVLSPQCRLQFRKMVSSC